MDNNNVWQDPLSDKGYNDVEKWATRNGVVPFNNEQINKLYKMFRTDPSVGAVTDYISKYIFYGQFKIVWDPRTIFLDKKKKLEEHWEKFTVIALKYYFMFGMVPYRTERDFKTKDPIPVIPDINSGHFAMKINKKASIMPKPVFITQEDNKKKKESSYSKGKFKVFLFPDRFITISDPNVPSPLSKLLKPYYDLVEVLEFQRSYNFMISHPISFLTKEPTKINWDDITDEENADPKKRSVLEEIKEMREDYLRDKVERESIKLFNKQDNRNVMRQVSTDGTAIIEKLGRNLILQTLPEGFQFNPMSMNQIDFGVDKEREHFKNLVCTELGLDYGNVFGVKTVHPGQIEQMFDKKLSLVVENMRNMLDHLFIKVFNEEFPIETDRDIHKNIMTLKKETRDKEEQLKDETEQQKSYPIDESEKLYYIPKGSSNSILLNENIPLFPPYIDWKPLPKSEESKKLDQSIVNLAAQGLISQKVFDRYLYNKYPELAPQVDQEGNKDTEEEFKFDSTNINVKNDEDKGKDKEEKQDKKDEEEKEDDKEEKKEEEKEERQTKKKIKLEKTTKNVSKKG